MKKDNLSLYIHIPFCKAICHFCNFVTFANKAKFIPEYIEALVHEIKERSKKLRTIPIETIYFGGGTPSLLEPEKIEKILSTIKDNFTLIKKPEISIECNPESLDRHKVRIYKRLGINRISLGIQSFNKKTLFRVGRPHGSEEIQKALQAIILEKFKNFGTDFIIGLPYQTLSSFQQEVEKIIFLKPPHLSFYFLSFDTARINRFSADCPSEEEQIAMYHYLTKTLREKGYHHYEVSNYALPGYECKHNLRYWQQKDYLGLGLGAFSIIDNKTWRNTENLEEYLNNPLITREDFILDPETQRLEHIMLSLRTSQGINKKQYQTRFGDIENILTQAKEFIETGDLIEDVNTIHASEKGLLIVDTITKKLL